MKPWKSLLAGLLTVSGASLVFLCYYCVDKCGLDNVSHSSQTPVYTNDLVAFRAGGVARRDFNGSDLTHHLNVNIEGEDVFVFLHIQKTSGTTFGKHLVDDLEVYPPCNCYKRKKKHCDCYTKTKKIWLFSRFTTGWSCGLHADWTELTECVDKMMDKKEKMKRKRRYHYITVLRNPVKRFLSEWMHVFRGATWKTAKLNCNGRSATLEEVPFCYDEIDWKNVSLREFINCPHNLAINRQTRMMANLSMVNCYNNTGMTEEERNLRMLESAKENLRNMSFFGLTEYQNLTQLLFEDTFSMNFVEDFVQWTSTHSSQTQIASKDMDRIFELNKIDILLYQYAKDLFFQRVEKMTQGPRYKKLHNSLLQFKSENRHDEFNDDEFAQDEEAS